MRRRISVVMLAAVLWVVTGVGPAVAQQAQAQTDPGGVVESTTTTAPSSTTSTTAPSTSTTVAPTTTIGPTSTTVVDEAPGAPPETTTLVPVEQPSIPASVGRTDIPVGSILIAGIVLAVMGVLVGLVLRRRGPGTGAAPTEKILTAGGLGDVATATASETLLAGTPTEGRRAGPAAEVDLATLQFLLEAGGALIDAGDPVDDVHQRVSRIARANGIDQAGVVVLPTALMVSVPRDGDVQTEVRTAGRVKLRLDQIDEVFRIVEEAERGAITPAAGLAALTAARRAAPLFAAALRLVGAALLAAGLVPVLGGSGIDLVVAAALGLGIGAMQIGIERRAEALRDVQAFTPLVAAFAVAVVVFALGRVVPDLSVFVPVVAPLVTFLPGGLLTTAVLELSTGQLVSGAGRLASGGLQLALLAIGVVAGAQLIGVPPSTITEPVSDPLGVALAWLGVGVFGVGVFLFHGSRRSSLPWMVIVLYVAYAGQVLGGVFFGGVLSAFFGALAMTPVAVLASRQRSGPPMLVSFLPGFWLLVPGALGLVGVTKVLGGERIGGLEVIVTTGATMIGVAFGVLLGTAIGTRLPSRLPWPSRAPNRSLPGPG